MKRKGIFNIFDLFYEKNVGLKMAIFPEKMNLITFFQNNNARNDFFTPFFIVVGILAQFM